MPTIERGRKHFRLDKRFVGIGDLKRSSGTAHKTVYRRLLTLLDELYNQHSVRSACYSEAYLLKRHWPRSVTLAVRSLVALACAFLILPAVARVGLAQVHTFAGDRPPSGLLVVRGIRNSSQDDRALDDQAMKNPFISGVAFQIHWSDIESARGKPDWSKLDDLFAAAESSKKWVELSVYAGFFAPAWALEGAKSQQFPVQYGPEKGKLSTLAMPWDGVYLDHWFEFLKRLSDRYGKSPAFKVVVATGPTSVSDEMTLPQSPDDLQNWQRMGYTPSKYTEAWGKVFQTYAADFPHQYVALVVGNGLNINDRSQIQRGQAMRSRQQIVDDATRLLGRRFVLENHDLHAGSGHQSPATSFVMSYSGRVTTGLETTCAAVNCSPEMGSPGDPPDGLRKSIDMGMQPNSAGGRVDFVEIYEPDVLSDAMQPVLKYGASRFAR